ncbi:MAG: hypothetical protein Q8T03_02555 [Bacteroidota bacterium]|nr:hypothetical protein [Bacteroidota bacterium]
MIDLNKTYNWLTHFFCEPTTAITDYMLAVFCFWCFKSVFSLIKKTIITKSWGYFFLFIGGSTFMGGLAHTTNCLPNPIIFKTSWLAMQLFSGASLFFAQRAIFNSEINSKKIKTILEKIALLQLIIFSVSVFIFMDFRVVAFNSLIGLIQLLVLSFPKKIYDWEYKFLLTSGFLISFLTIYVNRTKLSLAYWFNYNDISHFIMFASLFLIYKGITYKYNQDSFFQKNNQKWPLFVYQKK